MVKRKCLHCGEILFSSSTNSDDWICDICHEPIPKSQEREIYEEYEKNVY